MLTILGPKSRYCDGVTRRGFLKIGALSFGAAGFNSGIGASRAWRSRGSPGACGNGSHSPDITARWKARESRTARASRARVVMA